MEGRALKQNSANLMLAIAVVLCLAPNFAFGHGGRLDENSCHIAKKDDKFHCHEPWYKAEVRRVIDGDTLSLKVFFWIKEQSVKVNVRIRNIDTPEVRTKCRPEKAHGRRAQAFLKSVAGKQVYLFNVSDEDKFGRVSADIFTSDWENIATLLIKRGLARRYDGGKRPSWGC